MPAISNDWSLQKLDTNFNPDGAAQTLASLGIEGASYELPNLAADTLTFTVGGRGIEAGILWDYGTNLVLINPNGERAFFGRVEPWTIREENGMASTMGRLVNPFWYLEKLMYQQTYRVAATRDAGGNPLTFNTYTTPRVVLNILYNGAGAGFYSATTGQQIADAVNWAITQGAPIKLGTVDPASTPFSDFQKGIFCSEVIKKMFRIEPDFVMDWDYSTTPFPTVHFRKATSLQPLLIDLATTDIREQIQIRERPDWQRSYVRIYYDETSTFGQNSYLGISVDQYPNPLPADIESKFRGVDLFADLQGARVAQTSEQAVFQSAIFDITSLATWKKWCPELADGDNILNPLILTAASTPPAGSANDSTQNYSAPLILTLDENDDAGFSIPYNPACICEIQDGHLPDWLAVAPFNFSFQKVRATAWVKYTAAEDNSTQYKFVHHDFVAINVNTNGITAAYAETTSTIEQFAEVPPVGLAQQMWTSWHKLAIEGNFLNVENVIGEKQGISRSNCLNFKSAKNPAWQNVKALVQRISGTIEKGATRVEFGAPLHITGHELIDAVRATRFRTTTIDLAYLFGGALSSGGGTVRHPHKGPSRHSHAAAPQKFKSAYRVKDDLGDYYRCRTWDGTNEGATDVLIAKVPALRTSLTNETLNDGSVSTYTYVKTVAASGMSYYQRNVSNVHAGNTVFANEQVTPEMLFNSQIIAESISPITLSTQKFTLMDCNVDNRGWGKI